MVLEHQGRLCRSLILLSLVVLTAAAHGQDRPALHQGFVARLEAQREPLIETD